MGKRGSGILHVFGLGLGGDVYGLPDRLEGCWIDDGMDLLLDADGIVRCRVPILLMTGVF